MLRILHDGGVQVRMAKLPELGDKLCHLGLQSHTDDASNNRKLSQGAMLSDGSVPLLFTATVARCSVVTNPAINTVKLYRLRVHKIYIRLMEAPAELCSICVL